MNKIINVGMADLQCAVHPVVLTTIGLGSCVGIALYDPLKKIAGLAHIMLPSSELTASNQNAAKFADSAIVKLISDMIRIGAAKERLRAKLAGGSQMFSFQSSSPLMMIGQRNIDASKEMLNRLRIPVVSEDTGGNYGRTVELYSCTGKYIIKTIGRGKKEI